MEARAAIGFGLVSLATLATCSSSPADASSSASGSTGAGAGVGSSGHGAGGASVAATSTATSAAISATSSTSTSSTSSSSGGLDPSVAPGGNFDLSGWDLQLPIGSTGSPTIIAGSQLAGPNGFTDIYFKTDATDGAMTFLDPTTGVTTSGSLHPRSELREVTVGWTTAGMNVETVTIAVPTVPDHVTIGQIFQSAPAPSKPLLELQYAKGGSINLLLEDTNQGGSSTTQKVATVADGSMFTYELSLTGTTIQVTINGAPTMFTLPATFVGESFYFKCGDYDQTAVAGTPGTTPGTVVKVYALRVVHM